jgi:hypothetical protein
VRIEEPRNTVVRPGSYELAVGAVCDAWDCGGVFTELTNKTTFMRGAGKLPIPDWVLRNTLFD